MNTAPSSRCESCLYELSWFFAQDGKAVLDVSTLTIVEANPAAERLTGFARSELMGMDLTQLAPPVDHARIREEIGAGRMEPTVYLGFNILRKDGRTLPISISSSGVLDLHGRALVILEFRDITGLLEAERQLSAQNWALAAFSTAAETLGHAETDEQLYKGICEAITAQSAYILAWVGLAKDDLAKSVQIQAASGVGAGYLEDLPISWDEAAASGQGPVGRCLRSGEIEILEDAEESLSFAPWRERARRHGIRSSVTVPLDRGGGLRGVLAVYSTLPGAFRQEAVAIFERLGSLTARGIWALEQKRQLDAERERLAEALAGAVFGMVAAMEARDPYTASHENRVADIALAIGGEMGFSESRLHGLKLAAMVHDVGKIGIPSEILNKPGRLSPAEYALVKEHPEIGYTILKDIPFTWPVASMVRQHHEKLDGTGYPLGLKDAEILPESKVLAVADIVEAMGSDRPYRASMGIDAALAEIEGMAGTKLDAEAVRICCALFRERRLVLSGLNGS